MFLMQTMDGISARGTAFRNSASRFTDGHSIQTTFIARFIEVCDVMAVHEIWNSGGGGGGWLPSAPEVVEGGVNPEYAS